MGAVWTVAPTGQPGERKAINRCLESIWMSDFGSSGLGEVLDAGKGEEDTALLPRHWRRKMCREQSFTF